MTVEFHPDIGSLDWIKDDCKAFGLGVTLRREPALRTAQYRGIRVGPGGPYADWTVELRHHREEMKDDSTFHLKYREAQRLLALLEKLVDEGVLERTEIDWPEDGYWGEAAED